MNKFPLMILEDKWNSKSLVKPIVVAIGFCLFISACVSPPKQRSQTRFQLETMGTVAHITLVHTESIDSTSLLQSIDSLLQAFNQSLSTYIPNSTISTFNASLSDTFLLGNDTWFPKVFTLSKSIYGRSAGNFDPTVMPLVRAWGFAGDTLYNEPTDTSIQKLLNSVGMDLIELEKVGDSFRLIRFAKHVELDFSAVAKGYGVDVVSGYLTKRGFDHFMVEIGGEVRCRGKNVREESWRIGVERPDERNRTLYGAVNLGAKAMATSGNYRNFRLDSVGNRVVHTLSPITGYPIESELLSVSVIDTSCAKADALATACMVLGRDGCLALLNGSYSAEGLLILDDCNGGYEIIETDGFPSFEVFE